MKILNLKIISPENDIKRNIEFNKAGISLIYGNINMPEDNTKTSNSLGKTLLLKFIDYILGAKNDTKIVPEVLRDYKLKALVEFQNEEYTVIRKLGSSDSIFINKEKYNLTEYKDFFKINRNLFRNQIILSNRKGLINSYGSKPNKEEIISFLKLLNLNSEITSDIEEIYTIQDEIKQIKTSKKDVLKLLNELDEKKVDEEIFYLEKEINKLEEDLNSIESKIKNIQITDIKENIINEYSKENNDFKKLEELINYNNLEIDRMKSFIEEYSNVDINTNYIFKLYEKAKIEIPDLIRKKLVEVQKFHENVYSDRKNTMSRRIKELETINNTKLKELEIIKKKLDELGKLISENKVYKENIALYKKYSEELKEKKYLQGSFSHIKNFEDNINEKDKKLDDTFNNLKDSFSQKEEYIKSLQDLLYSFANILYKDKENRDINAYLKISPKKKHQRVRPIEIKINIDYDRGEGVGQEKNNLIDILLMDINQQLDFFIQDSSCYSGIDVRQVSKTLIKIDEIAKKNNKQAIVSVNKFQLSENKDILELIRNNTVIELNEDDYLLKFKFT